MVKLLKSGSWALEGVRVVEMVEGVDQSFGAAEDFKLVEAGWAEWVKVVPVAEGVPESVPVAEAEPEAADLATKTKAK